MENLPRRQFLKQAARVTLQAAGLGALAAAARARPMEIRPPAFLDNDSQLKTALESHTQPSTHPHAPIMAANTHVKDTKTHRPSFLKAHGARVIRDGKPFRNVGANIPDLFERFLHGDETGATQTLADAQSLGIRLVRCFGSTWGPQGFGLFETGLDQWLAAYNRMLAAADDHGIGVIPSLLFNANMLPGYVQQHKGRPEEGIVDFFTPGSLSNNLAVEYVTTIVSHFQDDPRVLFWEIGNEYNLEADLSAQWKQRPANQIPTSDNIRSFLAQMAALIRSLDKNHLITSGNSDMRSYAWHIRQAMLQHRNSPDPLNYPMDWTRDTLSQYMEMLRFFNPPPLDLVCVHHYPPGKDSPSWLPPDDSSDSMLPFSRKAADSLRQPLFIGEFGQKMIQDGKEVPAPYVLDVLRRVRGGEAPLAAIWSWEFQTGAGDQDPYSLSSSRAPHLAAAIRETNQAIGE